MLHWPWWLGGVALALVPIVHFLLLRRMMAVSGRITAIVNRLRHGPETEPEMSAAELAEALRAATVQSFGAAALEAPVAQAPAPELKRPQRTLSHAAFFAGLVIGGVLSAALARALVPVSGLSGERFSAIFDSPLSGVVLFGGGLLVGFGTRMAAGCTSGHGLCGVSRFQPGSLLATAAFFGTGIVTSFALGALL